MAFTAVASTTVTVEAELKRIYDPEYFDLSLNVNAPYYSMLKSSKRIMQRGEGLYWPFTLALPQAQGWLPESSSFAPVKPRLQVQARMRPVQIGTKFKLSFILEAVGTAEGTLTNKDSVRQAAEDAFTGAIKHLNRVFAGTEGTGRLGQIEASTTTSDTFIMKKPNRAWLIQEQMLLDVYTLTTGGAISTVADDATQLYVKSVNYNTGAVVVTTDIGVTAPSLSLVADEHVYAYPDYNNAPNGLLNLVDDGDFATTIHNQSRNTYGRLKSYVSKSTGASRPLTEEMLQDMAAWVKQLSGKNIDKLIMNSGQERQYYRFVKPQRKYEMSTSEKPGPFNTGATGKPQFFFNGGSGTVEVMEDIIPATVFGITSSTIVKFEARKFDWIRPNGKLFEQAVGSSGRETAYEAHAYGVCNQGCLQPNANGAIRDLLEPQMLGEAAE